MQTQIDGCKGALRKHVCAVPSGRLHYLFAPPANNYPAHPAFQPAAILRKFRYLCLPRINFWLPPSTSHAYCSSEVKLLYYLPSGPTNFIHICPFIHYYIYPDIILMNNFFKHSFLQHFIIKLAELGKSRVSNYFWPLILKIRYKVEENYIHIYYFVGILFPNRAILLTEHINTSHTLWLTVFMSLHSMLK